ncbi:MAG: O-antigen ligase family protein [Clostridiales bacterium]|nr:O-antigen ligase family protein [Clostridiales bacterium]
MKFTITELYFYIILFFPITTLFQDYIDGLNRLAFIFLFLIQTILFTKRIRKKTLWVTMVMMVNYLYSLMVTHGSPDNLNDLFYFPFSIIFMLYISENMGLIDNFLERKRVFVQRILGAWNVLVFLSLLLPSSYGAGWGGSKYFTSFCGSVFRLAPTAIFIMSLALCAMVYYKERKYFAYTLFPLVTIYMGGSRTYLLVALALFMIVWYFFLSSKRLFFLSMLPLGGILIGAISISSMGDKLLATSYTADSYFDFWGTISSGRTVFWAAEVEAFKECGIIQKLLGGGYNYIYDINEAVVQARIWAHNDFLNLLIGNGIVGLGLYLYAVKEIFNNIKEGLENKQCGWIPIMGCFAVWFINAMFNMFYTYFCALLAFPLLICAVYKKCDMGREEDASKDERYSHCNLPL